MDVIKTRIQARNFEARESGLRIVANMAKNEGFLSFFKGLTFSFWLAQTLIPTFGKYM
jgi:uncharacterized membrane protein (UPF0127 family)